MVTVRGPVTPGPRRDVVVTPSSRSAILSPARWIMLLVGITGLGLGMSLVVRADLGAGPWTVFHLGLAQKTGLSVGRITQLVGLAIIGSTALLLRQKPGVGTVANMILVGFIVDLCLSLIGTQLSLLLRAVYLALGIALTGMGTAVYITAGLGAGPRDGLMMGLHLATKRSIRSIRIGMEILALLVGAALGGRAGLGTIAAALLTGPIIQLFIGIAGSLAPWRASNRVTEGMRSQDG